MLHYPSSMLIAKIMLTLFIRIDLHTNRDSSATMEFLSSPIIAVIAHLCRSRQSSRYDKCRSRVAKCRMTHANIIIALVVVRCAAKWIASTSMPDRRPLIKIIARVYHLALSWCWGPAYPLLHGSIILAPFPPLNPCTQVHNTPQIALRIIDSLTR